MVHGGISLALLKRSAQGGFLYSTGILAMSRGHFGLIVGALLLFPSVASAQFSDSYNFLKFVRDRDGNKATELLSKPGTVIIDTKDGATGDSALHIVTRGRDLVWINFLLARGAKPNSRNVQGDTPLMVATQLRFVEAAQALLRFGAQVNLGNSGGETPLIRAVQQRDAVLVRLYMTNGANADKADTIGYSARDYAKRDTRATAILKIIEVTKPKPSSVTGPKL
jgi:uncharacterized protein